MIINQWYNDEKTIILQTLSDDWTWDEILQSNKAEMPKLMGAVEHTVHVIVSLEQSPGLPSGSAILKGKDATMNFPDNLGLLVIVSPIKYIRVLTDMVSNIAIINDERKLKSATTIDQALDIISDTSKILD